jgi:hypothetical protein
MNIEILQDDDQSQSESLFRFLSLHKFISLLRQKTLFFTRLDLLSDPFEGVSTTLIKQRYLARLIPTRDRMNPRLPQDLIEKNLLEKEYTEKHYNKEALIKQKSQFVNCWFRGDRESMAMWNLYSNKESVALKVDKNDLLEYLTQNLKLQPLMNPKHKLICGPVKYFKLNPVDLYEKVKNVTYSAFKKDVSFSFENEYRLLIATPKNIAENNPPNIELKISHILFEKLDVIAHPEMLNWQYDNITQLCHDIKFRSISRSQIEIK